jgi:UDP-GlcNAc:undecaprenyl-phosphate/decaprenyl-phosphate GlcNAc-1-phosphate transferase
LQHLSGLFPYWPYFVLAFGVTYLSTFLVQRLAVAAGAVDTPGEERRVHTAITPRWGGIAIYLGFVTVLLGSMPHDHYVWAMLFGGTLLLGVGLWDDRFGIRPGIKLIWQLVAAAILIVNGVGIDFISSPFGGVLHLDNPAIAVSINHSVHHFRLYSDGFTIFWVVGMVNTINFLDGLDGLASGVSAIGAVIIAALSVTAAVDQPQTATLAIGLAGAAAGFLPRNFYPAKLFMGDSGSMFLGFILGVLAILSGSKVATAVLVLGFPILDVAWAIVRRRRRGVSAFTADRQHLHHLLLEVGFSQRTAVLTLYSLTGLFGILALSADSGNKLVLMGVLLAVMAALLTGLALRIRSQRGARAGTR